MSDWWVANPRLWGTNPLALPWGLVAGAITAGILAAVFLILGRRS